MGLKAPFIIPQLGGGATSSRRAGRLKIFDSPQWRGEKFWMPPEGGPINFGRVGKGGEKYFRLDLFFLITEIQCFLVFLWVLGYFRSFWSKEGVKNFRRVAMERAQFCDVSLGGKN